MNDEAVLYDVDDIITALATSIGWMRNYYHAMIWHSKQNDGKEKWLGRIAVTGKASILELFEVVPCFTDKLSRMACSICAAAVEEDVMSAVITALNTDSHAKGTQCSYLLRTCVQCLERYSVSDRCSMFADFFDPLSHFFPNCFFADAPAFHVATNRQAGGVPRSLDDMNVLYQCDLKIQVAQFQHVWGDIAAAREVEKEVDFTLAIETILCDENGRLIFLIQCPYVSTTVLTSYSCSLYLRLTNLDG